MVDRIMALFWTAVIGIAWLFFAYMVQKNQEKLPEDRKSFPDFARYMIQKQRIWLGITLLGALFLGFFVGFILVCLTAVPWFGLNVKSKDHVDPASEAELENLAQFAMRDWLLELGPTVEERAKKLEAIFTERTKTIIALHFEKWVTYSGDTQTKTYLQYGASRSLAAMSDRECSTLRIVELLNSAVGGTENQYRRWRAALVWGDGKGQTFGSYQYLNLDPNNAIRDYIAQRGLSVDAVINAVSSHVAAAANDTRLPESIRAMCRDAMDAIKGRAGSGGGGGGGSDFFLKSSEAPTTVYASKSPYAIRLGTFDDGSWLSYSDSGALLTIAPPGSGKSQCHVIPNLLQWKAPAVVLDVKGEIYAATSKWRAENVGPVYRFAPTDPKHSAHYNPLVFVSDDPNQLWQEARFLTDMLIVPGGNKDNQFWDNKAKELVTAAVAYICYSFPPAQRSMSKLLEIIHGGSALDAMIVGLRTAVNIRAMVMAGTSLAEMNEKTRSDVLATVQTSFHGWGDAPVEQVTDRCDWSPLDLRNGVDGKYPTVYICLKPREVDSYISILRVFIAQHIRMLTGEMPSETIRAKVLPILFLLDELPRLKVMPPVAEAIEIGASYGLRIWMFAQSVGQLKNAYANADGMMGNCAVRCYMNPSGADGLAEKLSEELGYVSTLADGTRKRMVEASELAGPTWEKKLLALATSTRPARLNKMPLYQNPELQGRMGSL